MRFLLSALAGLSIIGGASAPLIHHTNSSNSNITNVSPLTEERVDLDGVQEIDVKDSARTWMVSLASKNLTKVNKITFEGGGLASSVQWKDQTWKNSWSSIDVVPGNGHLILLDETHDDNRGGVDKVHILITSQLFQFGHDENGTYYYTLVITFLAGSINSTVPAVGNLTIGNALVFND